MFHFQHPSEVQGDALRDVMLWNIEGVGISSREDLFHETAIGYEYEWDITTLLALLENAYKLLLTEGKIRETIDGLVEYVWEPNPTNYHAPPYPSDKVTREVGTELDQDQLNQDQAPESDIQTAILKVLKARFRHGFKPDLIGLARLRIFLLKDCNFEWHLPDDDSLAQITSLGTSFDGKVYVVSEETKGKIKGIVDEYFLTGAQIIFWQELYARHEDWLFEQSIVSDVMLKGILKELFPDLNFTQTYFGHTDKTMLYALEDEILRVWGDAILLTYKQIAERLEYVPLEKVKHGLSASNDFIWDSPETYTHISKVDVAPEEQAAILEYARKGCEEKGYVSMADLPIGEIGETGELWDRNHELSVHGLHGVIFSVCLSHNYEKRGKIVTCKGDTLDALAIMKDYCRTLERCTLNELLEFERELTGECYRWHTLEAGYAEMVRIDRDNFVATKHVDFDVYLIDEALGYFVRGNHIPLKSVVTFATFPPCGYPWNLFLLESFCRRFSYCFRFDAPGVNSKNAGAVIRKSCNLLYVDIMAEAVAQSDVILEEVAVCDYLFNSGYIGRRTNPKITGIIEKARVLRGRRV